MIHCRSIYERFIKSLWKQNTPLISVTVHQNDETLTDTHSPPIIWATCWWRFGKKERLWNAMAVSPTSTLIMYSAPQFHAAMLERHLCSCVSVHMNKSLRTNISVMSTTAFRSLVRRLIPGCRRAGRWRRALGRHGSKRRRWQARPKPLISGN